MTREVAAENYQTQELGSDDGAGINNRLALEVWSRPLPDKHSPQPPKVYEAPASQAISAPPDIAGASTELPYNSPVKLNVQITNVPEVSCLNDTRELSRLAAGTMWGLRQTAAPLLEITSHPEKLSDMVIHDTQVAHAAVTYYYFHPGQLGPDIQEALADTQQTVADTLQYPLDQEKIGEHAGQLMPDFAGLGGIRVLNTKELGALGGVERLEQLSDFDLEKLGIKRFAWSPLVEARDVPEHAYNNEFTRTTVHQKVAGYLFNPDQQGGWNKGAWFKRALNYDPLNPEHSQALIKQIHFDPASAIPRQDPNPFKQYGPRWTQHISIAGPAGGTLIHGIRLGWLWHDEDGMVRLTTIMPPK